MQGNHMPITALDATKRSWGYPHPPCARRVRLGLLVGLCLATAGWGSVGRLVAAEAPDPAKILEIARMAQRTQSAEVRGRLRTDGQSQEYPFDLSIVPGRVQFVFPASGLEVRLTTGNAGSRLDAGEPGKLKELSGQALHEAVLGTGVSYQDLAMQFLYWPDPKFEQEEVISTRRSAKILLRAPQRSSLYAAVFVWIDLDTGAIMQIEGYDWEGKHVKRFKVISGQKLGGEWMLKQMRVEDFEPGTRKVRARTYIEIDGEKE